MSIEEENKALVYRFWKELNKGNLEVWNDLCAPEYVYHGTANDSTLEQAKNNAAGLLAAFPDLNSSVNEMIVEGEYVANRYTIKATHQYTYRGIKPTGKQIIFSGMEINRINDGKFVETWGISDTFGMMQQLGAIPLQ